jgi:GDP-L-fucose synthase
MAEHSIFVAGHNGMVGSAIVRNLSQNKLHSIITKSRQELDLTNQLAVRKFFESNKIDGVILAAAKVGGIMANNTQPADFISINLSIQSNVIDAAFRSGVKKLLFLGSSCIYPREAEQPMAEEALLTGLLEPTNLPYAVAKISGIVLCESYRRQHGVDYRSVMPTNLYGPHDNFDLESSHVLPALIRKFHEAKQSNSPSVQLWGTGKPLREFLHVDDMAAACVHVLFMGKKEYEAATPGRVSHLNVGSNEEVSIFELAKIIGDVVGYAGNIDFDTSKPDGAPRKLMVSQRLLSTNWAPKFSLQVGIEETYKWFLDNK